MTANEKAAVIGCALMGVSVEQIAEMFIYPVETIKKIIAEYEKANHKIKK